ncbi:hypothetical protein IF1G_06413 [Cordyceps javanica]|uniref:Uncharacterized protein n=1 Tax=Cordyceps javanica TaxID=43265 RepID=A0A545V139_9HYPO|nr:hypothetical protein IF1G_06413 [Cordyceps javanica]TQW02570.1 hypothetical protein IF2G_09961 [Cordyceps javanica]
MFPVQLPSLTCALDCRTLLAGWSSSYPAVIGPRNGARGRFAVCERVEAIDKARPATSRRLTLACLSHLEKKKNEVPRLSIVCLARPSRDPPPGDASQRQHFHSRSLFKNLHPELTRSVELAAHLSSRSFHPVQKGRFSASL